MAIRRLPAITPEQENFRVQCAHNYPNMLMIKRDPVEPVPVGTYVAMVFKVTGYDQDCDGSLMARLAAVDASGDETGWKQNRLGLYPSTTWVLDGPADLDSPETAGDAS